MMGGYFDTLYNHTLSINEPTCMNVGGSDTANAVSAGSSHPDGANVVFADGHVRFVKHSITPSVWRALGTCSGKEVVSSDSF
jgi:prepilin-type processing-associated H-X9-DG protein